MDVFSGDLTPSNTSATVAFDLDWTSLETSLSTQYQRPFIAASYGVDAYDTQAWMAQAGKHFGPGYPTDHLARAPLAAVGTYVYAANGGFVSRPRARPAAHLPGRTSAGAPTRLHLPRAHAR